MLRPWTLQTPCNMPKKNALTSRPQLEMMDRSAMDILERVISINPCGPCWIYSLKLTYLLEILVSNRRISFSRGLPHFSVARLYLGVHPNQPLIYIFLNTPLKLTAIPCWYIQESFQGRVVLHHGDPSCLHPCALNRWKCPFFTELLMDEIWLQQPPSTCNFYPSFS